eukprot:Nitzschia sp. Nitz4//scaffold166_size90379//7618//10428//NITZ4_005045-RA/size90379-processed-gene-0.51-mRNA-1//-1//CDS//3329538160//3397//frame0
MFSSSSSVLGKRSAGALHAQSDHVEVKTVEELDNYFQTNMRKGVDEEALMKKLYVQGDTQVIGSPDKPDYVHPVAQLLHERRRNNSQSVEGEREDGFKVALVVEGGGMRGCVSAGMICAVHHLGLRDVVDVVYGSSAGSIIGAYFVTGQLPWFGPELYYDKLPTSGPEFIQTKHLSRALGLGWLDPRHIMDYWFHPNEEKAVLNLEFLLKKTLQQTKPLDWEKFQERQKVQPLKVVASALKSEKPLVMDMEEGHFESLEDLSNAMHASCLLPGIAGPVMNIRKDTKSSDKPKFVLQNNLQDPEYEPLGDALFFAPIPYSVAVEDGITHAIVLRSRPDGTDVTGKTSFLEKLMFQRYLLRKNNLPNMYDQLVSQKHKKLYAREVLDLNQEACSQRDVKDTSAPHALTIALPPGSPEIARLENDRATIFDGIPTVDLSATDRDELVRQVASACSEYGFFQVINHGFPPEVIEEYREQIRQFFALPQEVKVQWKRSQGNSRGYFDDELTKQRRDWKQCLDFGVPGSRDWNVADGDDANECLDGWNQVAPPEVLPLFRSTLTRYFDECARLSDKIAVLMAEGLGQNENSDVVKGLRLKHSSYLRTNYYPTCNETYADGFKPLGISPHQDAGFLTLLLQDDDCHSLQVLKDDTWITVQPLPGSFTINTGDMAQAWSNGKYKAPLHRVLSSENKERYSAPFFYNPPYDAVIKPLVSEDPDDKPLYHDVSWGYYRAVRFAGDLTDLGVEIQVEQFLRTEQSDHLIIQAHFLQNADTTKVFTVESYKQWCSMIASGIDEEKTSSQ